MIIYVLYSYVNHVASLLVRLDAGESGSDILDKPPGV